MFRLPIDPSVQGVNKPIVLSFPDVTVKTRYTNYL